MDEELKKIFEENLRISRENNQMLKGIKRHFFWQKLLSLFYFIIIVGPIIWGIIYLPALLGPMISQYQDLLGGSPADGQAQNIKISPKLINQLKNLNLTK